MIEPGKKYVVGLAFSHDLNYVTVIQKRPSFEYGPVFNGVGGKIEPGETPKEAMVREFQEETGELIEDWKLFASFISNTDFPYTIDCFCTSVDWKILHAVRQTTDEVPSVKHIRSEVIRDSGMANLTWLIEMARQKLDGKVRGTYVIDHAASSD